MAKKRNKVVDYAVYVVLRLFAAFIHMLSWPVAYRAATWLGGALYRFDRRHRERALGHLRLSFPDWSEQQIEDVARQSFRSLAYLGLEFLFTTRKITRANWQRYVTARGETIDEAVDLMSRHESGLILVTGHFGNWEVLAHALAVGGFPISAVARRLDNPYVDRHVMGQRESEGLRILDKKGAAAELDDLLDARGTVAFIADQDAGRKGVFVDFFSRPASTFKSIALMAMRHQAPIIVGYCRRLDSQFRFQIGAEQIIYPHQWADAPDPLRWITQTYTHALERIARGDPEQYLWVHRRWKHRPKGQPRPPDGIA